jgi:hypothetical protein
MCTLKDKSKTCCKENEVCFENGCVDKNEVRKCPDAKFSCNYEHEQCITGNDECCQNEDICFDNHNSIEKTCCNTEGFSCVNSEKLGSEHQICCKDTNKKCDGSGNCICCSKPNQTNVNGVCCDPTNKCTDDKGKIICCNDNTKTCAKNITSINEQSICCNTDSIYDTNYCCDGDVCRSKDGINVCCDSATHDCIEGQCLPKCGNANCKFDETCYNYTDKKGNKTSTCTNDGCKWETINYTPSNVLGKQTCQIDSNTDFVTLINKPKGFAGTISRKTDIGVTSGVCNIGNCIKRTDEENVGNVTFIEDSNNTTCSADFDCTKLPETTTIPQGRENSACMTSEGDFTGVLCKDETKSCGLTDNGYVCSKNWMYNKSKCEPTSDIGWYSTLEKCKIGIKSKLQSDAKCTFGPELNSRICTKCSLKDYKINPDKTKCCYTCPYTGIKTECTATTDTICKTCGKTSGYSTAFNSLITQANIVYNDQNNLYKSGKGVEVILPSKLDVDQLENKINTFKNLVDCKTIDNKCVLPNSKKHSKMLENVDSFTGDSNRYFKCIDQAPGGGRNNAGPCDNHVAYTSASNKLSNYYSINGDQASENACEYN